MTKQRAKTIVFAYFLIVFGAILARIDYFPFTWVPMYGARDLNENLKVVVGDKQERKRGFKATLANGQMVRINRHTVNMPSANFRRIYNERAFGEGPPQDRRERLELAPFNRWWYETFIGPETDFTGLYEKQLIDSFNKTLGLRPGDPDYIIRLEANVDVFYWSREDRAAGRINLRNMIPWRAIVTPTGSHQERMAVEGVE